MIEKKIYYVISTFILFFVIIALIIFINVNFLSKNIINNAPQKFENSPINLNIPEIKNNNSGNDEKFNPLKKYKISYKIYPKVMFGDNNSEIISFEAAINTKYVLGYGTDINNEKKIQNDVYETSHEITLENLEPNTKYFYSLQAFSDNGGYTEDFTSTFITKSSIQYNYHFAVLGDSRPVIGYILPKEFHQIIRLLSEKKFNFVVFTGDMVQLSDIAKINYESASEAWKFFTDAVSPMSSKIPVYLTVGNHDEPANNVSIQRYREVWTFPHNGGGKAGWYDELTYWFDFSNSLFIVLNSYEPGYRENMSPEQWSWLEKILAYQGFDHKFIFTHYPIMGSKRGVNGKSADLHKLFLKNKVTAVFTGHDHVYCKYKKDGLNYVITGGAGSPLYQDTCLGTEISQNHFIDVAVEGNTVTINSINKNNETIDTFSFNP